MTTVNQEPAVPAQRDAFDYGPLEEFESKLRAKSLTSLWETFKHRSTRTELAPHCWAWQEVSTYLYESADLVGIGGADDPNDRRVICFTNPTLADSGRTTDSIQVNVQLVKQGEIAEAHRHTENAMRFVLEANGEIYSTVDGEKMIMEPGDLVLTPNWAWHDHVNDSGAIATWLDILDSPLMYPFGAHFKDVWTDGVLQPVIHEDGFSQQRYRSVRPRTGGANGGAVPFAYKWRDTEATLRFLNETGEVDPHEGCVVDFAHPVTGGPTFPTMHCRMHLLPPRSRTRQMRRTGVSFYHAFSGRGTTVVGVGETADDRRTPSRAADIVELSWQDRDCFMVPTWRWQEHINDSDEPAFLFSIVDSPALRAFGWYREERS